MSGVQHLLGKLIDSPQQRDAIHVAVAPVTAGERIYPGQHVGFATEGDCETVSGRAKPIGIIDPYLPGPVQQGEKCWLFLYPGSASVVRHEWTHPAFTKAAPSKPEISASEEWLRHYADGIDITYNALIEGAKNFLAHDDYLVGGSNLEGEYTIEAFWPHFENVTGVKVPLDQRQNFFSCSC